MHLPLFSMRERQRQFYNGSHLYFPSSHIAETNGYSNGIAVGSGAGMANPFATGSVDGDCQ